MRFVIDQVDTVLAVRDDDTIDEIKEKIGRPVYLYAKKRVHMTARDIYNLFGRPLSAAELRTVFSNLNISKEVASSAYTLHDLVELDLGCRHVAWVPLGQSMPPSVPVVPCEGDVTPRPEDACLLDYMPIVDDVVYGVTDAPAYTLPTRATRRDITDVLHHSCKFLELSSLTEGLHSIHLSLKSGSNVPMPLDHLFRLLHASKDVPLIGRGDRYRAHVSKKGPRTFNGLTCWFDTGGWLTATLYHDGHVEVIFQCPETVMVPLASLAAILRPVNRFIRYVNNTLRWGTSLEGDLRADGNIPEGFPFFESVEHTLVLGMSYMYAADFIASRVVPSPEVFERVSKGTAVITTATSTILRVDHLTTFAALNCLRTYAGAYLYELWMSDAPHSYTLRQPRNVRYQASADTPLQECAWNHPRMVQARPPQFVLRGTQVGPPHLEPFNEGKLPATLEKYLGSKFYCYKPPTASSPFLQCMATHMSLTRRPMTVEGLKSLIVDKAKALFPLYENLVLQFSTNMTSSVRNHTPFVNFKNYMESEESIDFTFVWDIVCSRIFNVNLVIFNGDNVVSGKVEVIAPCSETLDPSRKTVLLLKHHGTFDLVYETVKEFDYPFLERLSKLYAMKSSPNLSATEVVRKLRGAKYKVLHQVTHLNQTIGFLAAYDGRTGLVPCYPAEPLQSPPCQDVQYLPPTSGVEVDAFLKEVHSKTKLPCLLTHLVQGGALTERYSFAPCSPPFPPLPVYKQNIAHEYDSYTVDPYPTPLPFAEESEQRYAMARQMLRDVLTPEEKERIRAILADSRAKSTRLEEVVTRALAPHIVVVPSVPKGVFFVGKRVLLTESNMGERFAEELARYVHYRDYIMGDVRVVGGVEYAVHADELLVSPFKVVQRGATRIAGCSCRT
jgi:hypothetical protein